MPEIRITGKYLNGLWGVGAKHALYREDGVWYHPLEEFPGALFDKNGYVVFQNREGYISSPYLQHAHDLHVPSGIASIPGYVRVINDREGNEQTIDANNEVIQSKREISLRLRNKRLADKVKCLYHNTCQICNCRLQINVNQYYSEVHHIKPLGEPHNGPDVIDNMICVCPNHHVLLDLGAIEIDKNNLLVNREHTINDLYISYHNRNIYNGFNTDI